LHRPPPSSTAPGSISGGGFDLLLAIDFLRRAQRCLAVSVSGAAFVDDPEHFELKGGETLYIGKPFYKKYDRAPIKLEAHADRSELISYRNIWVRELSDSH
jgi:hypothetical protein